MSIEKNKIYIPEIDGLRCIAVIAVILFHLKNNIFPSSFLGVDVFFVISGSLITKSLFRISNQKANFNILEFYEKRLIRLLPPLIFYSLIILIFLCLFDPSPGVSFITGISSLFGISNFYLISISDNYFSSSNDLNTFLQTWSLSIEAQFYLIYPIIFSVFYYKKNHLNLKKFLFFILIIFVFSLLFFINDYSLASNDYYKTHIRIWEILAGCITYLAFIQLPDLKLSKYINKNLILFFILICFLIPQKFSLFTTILLYR